MSTAVLPFNAGPNTKPSLARQIPNFACDIVRNLAGLEVNAINYLVRLDGEPPRFALVNPSESLNESEMIQQFSQQAEMTNILDGLLVKNGDGYEMTYRVWVSGSDKPSDQKDLRFEKEGIFDSVRQLIDEVATIAGGKLPDTVKTNLDIFGTADADAFLRFLEGYDALQYVDRSQGQVAEEFVPKQPMDELIISMKKDPAWEAPYLTLVQLCRACTQMRVGRAEDIEASLKAATEVAADDSRAYFALGEFYEAVNNSMAASEAFEKAHQYDPDEPAIIARLGIAQMKMGMPANAEKNFRRAMELEDENKPSADYLANVLVQTSRAHEVPAMWKQLVEAAPANPRFVAQYAGSLIQDGQDAEGEKAFEEGLKLENSLLIKRFYAPYLAQKKQDFDRAMDFYEDCLEAAPADVQLMIEYAQTLQTAGRAFEVPAILEDILKANPDQNVKAQTMAWKLELTEPKRIEVVQKAQEKMNGGDFQGAIKDLKPLKNWLADYWKMWALLTVAYSQAGEAREAEDSARRLLGLFPAYEDGYGALAAALNMQGRDEEAYNVMRYGASNIQGSVSIAINLALAAKRNGKDEEARELAKQLRAAVGDNEQLKTVLDELES